MNADKTISAFIIPYPTEIDSDYIHAFAPHLLDQYHSLYSNAAILLLHQLWPDQIAFLKGHGIVEGQAKNITLEFQLDHILQANEHFKGLHNAAYYCVFAGVFIPPKLCRLYAHTAPRRNIL
jgi:hypothetical protein